MRSKEVRRGYTMQPILLLTIPLGAEGGLECVMDKQSRALRRHHHDRMYRRARHIFRYVWWSGKHEDSEHDEHIRARRMANNMKICSCWMCCNPRNAFGRNERTIQELKAEDSFEDQLVDFGP